MRVAFEIDLKTIVRWILAALLGWAALGKIANLHEFYQDLVAYQLPLPSEVLRLTAAVLPWLELLCAVLLVAGTARRAALMWMAVLFAIFVLATGQAWARGLNISCGCIKLDFLGEGVAKMFESVTFAFFRAALLLALAIYVLRQRDERTLDVKA
jgi:uncharacterized membrane protein YphA (DoxX/SURF4 family)